MEVLYNNSFLIKISAKKEEDSNLVFFSTSRIVVPIKQLNKKSNEISCLIEELQLLIRPNNLNDKIFEIDVEYSGRSPYYSYWLKKMPEELISSFNCTIKLPDKNGDLIRVNKNHIIIKSSNCSRLLNITKDYISLQAKL
ncbi:hypothetical protein [Marinifilum flexuosum]|uniref:hypothetical protein n=1 Tax=Marinifilum flexuosum TaxID=1117708 RepID=UPI0024928A1F|nr:hypothetical protein [Marinifilum flexuosum]